MFRQKYVIQIYTDLFFNYASFNVGTIKNADIPTYYEVL